MKSRQSVAQSLPTGRGSTELIEAFDNVVQWHGQIDDELRELSIHCLAASGDLNRLQEFAESGNAHGATAKGCLAFLTGQFDAAEVAFSQLTT